MINLFDDHSTIVSEAKHTSIHGEGLKILNPIQMLQRLQILLAKVKVGIKCGNVLNEIREIINSLY